jgi:hypothetical protein
MDANGREMTSLQELASENHSPVGLARFTTCRAWLSQWSYDLSNADGIKSIPGISVFVLQNEADHLFPKTHGRKCLQPFVVRKRNLYERSYTLLF